MMYLSPVEINKFGNNIGMAAALRDLIVIGFNKLLCKFQ